LVLVLGSITSFSNAQTKTNWYGSGLSSIVDAATDSSGNLWFATLDDGLLVKSGNSWVNYNKYNSALPSNMFLSIAVAPDGSIWAANDVSLVHSKNGGWEEFRSLGNATKVAIGKNGEVWVVHDPGVHRYKNGTWTQYTEAQNPGFFNDYPIAIAADKNGVIWAGGYGYEMWKFDGTNWTTEKNLGLDTTTYLEILDIAFDKNNTQYVATKAHGLYVITPDTTMQFIGGDMGLYLDQINDIMVASDGKVWLAGEGGGIAIYDGTKFTNQTSTEGLGSDQIACLTGNANLKVAVNSEQGVSIFSGGKWTYFDQDKVGPFSTSGFFSLAKDASGNIWVGGLSELNKFDGTTWKSYRSGNSGVPDDGISAIAFDSKNKIWISTYYTGIASFDPATNTWTNFDQDNSGLPSNNIADMVIDGKDVLWLATDFGLVKFDGMTSTTYDKASGKLPVDEVVDLYLSKKGDLWIGTWAEGVVKFDGSTWTNYKKGVTGLSSDGIISITEDNFGNIYVGAQDGYTKFDGSTWTFVSATSIPLDGVLMLDLKFDVNNDIWIATESGVIHRLPTADSTYTWVANDQETNFSFQILIDGKDAWVANSGQLCRISNAITQRPSSTVDFWSSNAMNVFPNPVVAGEPIQVRLNAGAIENANDMVLVDNLGRVFHTQVLLGNTNGKLMSYSISTQTLSAGLYTLRVNGTDCSKKVMIVR